MANDKNKNNQNEDKLLDHLIRESRKKRSGQFIRPDEDVIISYVLGSATEAQTAQILEAMALSGQFRHEILDMLKGVAALEKSDVQRSIEHEKTKQIVESPNLVNLTQKYGKPHHQETSLLETIKIIFNKMVSPRNWKAFVPAIGLATMVSIFIIAFIIHGESEVWQITSELAVQQQKGPTSSINNTILILLLAVMSGIAMIYGFAFIIKKLSTFRISNPFLNWRSYAPAVPMVALVLIVTIPFMTQTVNELSPTMANVEPSKLISNATRSATGEKSYETPQDAALAEFRFLVKYENREFQLNPIIDRTKPDSTLQSIEIKIMDSSKVLVEKFNAYIPKVSRSYSDSPLIWILAFPSRNIYSMPIKNGSVEIIWPDINNDRGCLTITYQEMDGYKAIEGYIFR